MAARLLRTSNAATNPPVTATGHPSVCGCRSSCQLLDWSLFPIDLYVTKYSPRNAFMRPILFESASYILKE